MPELRHKLFVAGEHGQLAQALGRECLARGHAVQFAGRETADVTDRDAVIAAVKAFAPHLVVNAAGYTAVDKAEDDADQAFRINRDGALNVAAAAAEVGAPLIHVSTDYVYDGRKASPYVETDPTRPLG